MRNGNRSYIKAMFTCIVSIFMLLCSYTICVQASYYEMDVSIGFDNQAKYGRYVPVSVSLYSDEDFEGILSISTEFEGGSEQVISFPVTLTGGEDEIIRTYLALFVKNNNIRFSLKNLAGEEIKYKTVKLELLEDDYTELFVGVLSNNAQMADLFDNINLGEYSDITFPYILTRGLRLTVDDIWGDTLASLDCLDIIIVTWNIIEELTEEQIKMLIAWVASGKTLIVEYNDMLSGELRGLYAKAYNGREANDELRPELWIYSSDYDAGRIGFISTRSVRDFFSYLTTDNNELLGSILGKACTLEMINDVINYDLYYMNYDNSYDVEYMLSAMQGKEVPNINEYIVIIIIYIVLAGPVLYIVLVGFKKLKYLLPCIIVIAAIFSLWIYRMSSNTRFTDVFLQYANVVNIKNERVDEITYFSANVPYNDTYYLKFDSDYEIKPLLKMQEEEGVEDYLEILYDDITKITINKSLPFSKEFFEASNSSADINEWNIDVDVTYYNGRLSGAVINNSGKELKNTALILYDKIIVIGDIKNGEEKSLALSELITLPYYASDVADMIVDDDKEIGEANEKIRNAPRKMSGKEVVADYVISRYFEEKDTTPILVGFVDEELGLTAEFEAYGYTMFCKDVELNTSVGNLLYDPISHDNIVNIDNVNYDSYSNTAYSSSVRLQYNFEDKESILKIIFDCNVESDGDDAAYYGGFSGQVNFYNYTTFKYDVIDISKESFDVTELQEYLFETEDGYELIVQYNVETEGKYRYTEIKMPFVSVIRRIDNAESGELKEELW